MDIAPADGLDDAWQAKFRIFPQPPSPANHSQPEKTADPDGDGRSNLEESLLGTDPFVADAPWAQPLAPAQMLPPAGGIFTLTVPWTDPWMRYRIQGTGDLITWDWWAQKNGDGLPWVAPLDCTGLPKQFFRLVTDERDDDGDTLTNWHEVMVFHTNPALADTDGDGLADAAEVAAALNPIDNDSDDDGVNDTGDRFPLDPRRSDYIPAKFYAVNDLSTYLPAEVRNTFDAMHAALDDSHNVAFFGTTPATASAPQTGRVFTSHDGTLTTGPSFPMFDPGPAAGDSRAMTTPDLDQYFVEPYGAGTGGWVQSGLSVGGINTSGTLAMSAFASYSAWFYYPAPPYPFGIQGPWAAGHGTISYRTDQWLLPDIPWPAGAIPKNGDSLSLGDTIALNNAGGTLAWDLQFIPTEDPNDSPREGTYRYRTLFNATEVPALSEGSTVFADPASNQYFGLNDHGAFFSSGWVEEAGGTWSHTTKYYDGGALHDAPAGILRMNDRHHAIRETYDFGTGRYEGWFAIETASGQWTQFPLLELLKWTGKPPGTRDGYDLHHAALRNVRPKFLTDADPASAGAVVNGITFPNGAPSRIIFEAEEADDGNQWRRASFCLQLTEDGRYSLSKRESMSPEATLSEPLALNFDGTTAGPKERQVVDVSGNVRVIRSIQLEFEAYFERNDLYEGFDPPLRGDQPNAAADKDEANPKWRCAIGYPTPLSAAVAAQDIAAAGAATPAELTAGKTATFRYIPRDLNLTWPFRAEFHTGSVSIPGDRPAGVSLTGTPTPLARPGIITMTGVSGFEIDNLPVWGEAQIRIRAMHQAVPFPKPAAVLDVDVLPIRYIPIGLWYLEDGRPETDDAPPVEYRDAHAVLQRLNKVFRQACVQFIPANKDGAGNAIFLPVPRQGNAILEYGHPKVAAQPQGLLELDLWNGVEMRKVHAPDLPLPGAKIHLVLVRYAGPPRPGQLQPFGMSWSGGGVRERCFVQTQAFESIPRGANADGWLGHNVILHDFLTTCAHEVGHVLGLSTRNVGQANQIFASHDQGLFPMHLYHLDGTPVPSKMQFITPSFPAKLNRLPWSLPWSPFDKRRIEIGLMTQSHNQMPAMEDGGVNVQSTFPGSANRSYWIRHEDWRMANDRAANFEP